MEKVEYAGDYEIVARFLIPTDAHVVHSCLLTAGIPAIVLDDQLVQTQSLWTMALGGVRVLVPINYVREAREVIDAFNRGDLAIRDDDDSSWR